MFPSRNNQPRRDPHRLAAKKLQKRNKEVVYQPSVYRYTCRGAFHASSEQIGSPGTCHGFRSRLELLTDLERNTRENAIKDFTYMTDFELDDSGQEQTSDLNQQTKSILVSPALVYKELDKHGRPSNLNKLPEEELIRRQQWRCYGSTEVEYLVLQNIRTGDEKIAAIAPRNIGLSIRKIHSDDGTLTNIGLGWLNIVVDTGPEELDDSVDDTAAASAVNKVEEDEHHLHREELPPRRPSPGAIGGAKESAAKVYAFSQKLVAQMQLNASFIVENVQDDFVNRTYQAGEKIAAQFPKTVDRTARFMGKMLDHIFGDDDDDTSGPSK